jgi:AraC-like DNA-binding protein
VSKKQEALHIMAVDCCAHVLGALGAITSEQLTSISIGLKGTYDSVEQKREVDLIAIGVSKYPVRRIFISQIRAVYPNTPMLILRHEEKALERAIHGEFILSDRRNSFDLEIVSAVRSILPLAACEHSTPGLHYDIVRDVMRVISENFARHDLDLQKIATALSISAVTLSRILNKSVGVSFRQLLRNTRIEEAKRLLVSNQYSVKEVAALVGFADSHYFSRTFKVATGLSASEYRSSDAVLS